MTRVIVSIIKLPFVIDKFKNSMEMNWNLVVSNWYIYMNFKIEIEDGISGEKMTIRLHFINVNTKTHFSYSHL